MYPIKRKLPTISLTARTGYELDGIVDATVTGVVYCGVAILSCKTLHTNSAQMAINQDESFFKILRYHGAKYYRFIQWSSNRYFANIVNKRSMFCLSVDTLQDVSKNQIKEKIKDIKFKQELEQLIYE